MARVPRRTVLRAGALLAVAGAAGCSALQRTTGVGDLVRVAVSWSGTELAAFRSVLAGSGVDDYELIPFGDDIAAALGARTSGRPDVVAMPQIGLVNPNLAPLPNDVWRPEYDKIADDNGVHYGLPFKLAHKSVVWYRKQVFTDLGLSAPTTWDEWLALNNAIIAKPESGAPLALGGADGWMLAGFFENILLRNFPATYEELAARVHDPRLWQSDDVRRSLTMLGDMWGQPHALAGGPHTALVQQFPDAVLEVFKFRHAVMVVAPDFAESVIRHFGVPLDEVGTFTFPARSAKPGPLVRGGDLLVLTRPASPAAVELIRYLSTPQAPVPWIRDTGGFIAANPDTDPSFYSPILRCLAHELHTHEARFDLADQLGTVGGRDGLQLVLQDFLRAAGGSLNEAVRTAMAAMVAVEAG